MKLSLDPTSLFSDCPILFFPSHQNILKGLTIYAAFSFSSDSLLNLYQSQFPPFSCFYQECQIISWSSSYLTSQKHWCIGHYHLPLDSGIAHSPCLGSWLFFSVCMIGLFLSPSSLHVSVLQGPALNVFLLFIYVLTNFSLL